MKSLVHIGKNNKAFTTSLIIAKETGVEHRAVIILLKRHSKREILSSFEMLKVSTKGRPVEYAELSEIQATFLITMMKNSDIVLKFKERLVIQFFKLRDSQDRIRSNYRNNEWTEIREQGKIPRRLETDVIKEFIDYATEQGSKSAQMYYMNITKMENKALFIVEQKYKNLRDVLGVVELSTIQNADHIVARALRDGMNDKLAYKDIYKLAKERVEMFAEIRGKSQILALT